MHKKFQVNINLDDPVELMDFINTYGQNKGRRLANQLKLKGKGSSKLASAFSNYAWNKSTAISLRKSGEINRALIYESICDNIYEEDIQPVCDCW